MSFQVYKDPTFDAAVAAERRQKGCMLCIRYKYILGRHRCSEGNKFPACRGEKNGYVLSE